MKQPSRADPTPDETPRDVDDDMRCRWCGAPEWCRCHEPGSNDHYARVLETRGDPSM